MMNTKDRLNLLKGYMETWQLVFSYDLEPYSHEGGMVFKIIQKETGFSILMKIHEEPDCLRITQFELTEDSRLENISLGLYQASIVEIMFHTLEILFSYALQGEKREALFVLSEEEAAPLIEYDQIFTEIRTHTTRQGSRTFLTLPTFIPDYQVISRNMQVILEEVHCKLWTLQRVDNYIKNYLQNTHRDIAGDLKSTPQKKGNEQGKVVVFPKGHCEGA